MKNSDRWAVVFKALSNINRIKIIALLSRSRNMSVSDLAESLKISVTAVSNHLVLLQKLEVLRAEGRNGHVYYSLNQNMPQDFAKTIKLFLS